MVCMVLRNPGFTVPLDGLRVPLDLRNLSAPLNLRTLRMLLRLLIESYGTLVAVSAPLVMPLCDSEIPMKIPFAFRNK